MPRVKSSLVRSTRPANGSLARGFLEFLEEEVSVLRFRAGGVSAASARIERLLADRALAERMGQAAAEWARAHIDCRSGLPTLVAAYT